jgi:hypothetical protein
MISRRKGPEAGGGSAMVQNSDTDPFKLSQETVPAVGLTSSINY